MTKGACVDNGLVLFDPRDLRLEHLNGRQAFCFEKGELLLNGEQTEFVVRLTLREGADLWRSIEHLPYAVYLTAGGATSIPESTSPIKKPRASRSGASSRYCFYPAASLQCLNDL